MFEVKKARSRNTDVEYIEIDVKEACEYAKDHEQPHSVVHGNASINQMTIPISKKAEILLKTLRSKKSGEHKHFSITLQYNAHRLINGEWLKWLAGITFDEHLSFEYSNNINRFEVNKKSGGWEKIYVVMDGGFEAEDMKKSSYWLTEEEFNYVYERMEEE